MADDELLRHLIEVPTEARRLYPRGALFALEPAQLQVLIALVLGAADHTAGLAETLAMNRSTVSHSLAALEARGLIRRTDDLEDGRRSRLAATALGHGLADEFARSHCGD